MDLPKMRGTLEPSAYRINKRAVILSEAKDSCTLTTAPVFQALAQFDRSSRRHHSAPQGFGESELAGSPN